MKPKGKEFHLSSTDQTLYIEADDGKLFYNKPSRGSDWIDLSGTLREESVRKKRSDILNAGGLLRYESGDPLRRRQKKLENDRARQESKTSNQDYRMSHVAPTRDEISLSNIHQVMDLNFVSNSLEHHTAQLIMDIINDAPELITIYRSCPKHISEILSGDWVALTKDYAQEHEKHFDDGNSHILSKQISPSELFTDGNSIHEFGYNPTIQTLHPAMKKSVEDTFSMYVGVLTTEQLTDILIETTYNSTNIRLDAYAQKRILNLLNEVSPPLRNSVFTLLGEEITRSKHPSLSPSNKEHNLSFSQNNNHDMAEECHQTRRR